MKEIYNKLIQLWKLEASDCWVSHDGYTFFFLEGWLCINEEETKFVLENKIDLKVFLQFWDYFEKKGVFTLNFIDWYKNDKK